MKAVFALLVIYVGTFLVAIQGAPQSSVQAAQNQGAPQRAVSARPIDPAKEADIRALMELVGTHELLLGSVPPFTEQDREKHSVTASSEDQLVGIYDQHYSDDEIKGLLQFFGSPLGQKVAAEMPKINYEIQDAARVASAPAAPESRPAIKGKNSDVQRSARLGAGQLPRQQRSSETSPMLPADTQQP